MHYESDYGSNFDTFDEMWRHTIYLLHEYGSDQESRNGKTKELLGVTMTLVDPGVNFLRNERRALSPYYAAAEVLWYMSGVSDVDFISKFAPQYAHFAESDGKAYGAYGGRIFGEFDQLRAVVDLLKRDPDTRQAVVQFWRASDLQSAGSVKDVPCTLNWQFAIRDGELHMFVDMRSNDAWLGMPYDVFWNTTAMRIIANELGVRMGTYTHHVRSMHLYEKHWKAADEALDANDFCPAQKTWHYTHAGDTLKSFRTLAHSSVTDVRRLAGDSLISSGTAVSDLLKLCNCYIQGEFYETIASPLLNEAVAHFEKVKKQ